MKENGNPDNPKDWIPQTRHHHENGKDLIPIPSEIHNSYKHSGGHKTRFGSEKDFDNIDSNTDISGTFDYPPDPN